MATIHDVAKQAGVSTATVSRSFSRGHVLSQETRKRVMDVAARLNYQPRRAPAEPASGSGGASPAQSVYIGFQFLAFNEQDSLLSNDFYGPVLAGAQAEADALNMHLLLHTTNRSKLAQELPQMISQQAISGMLLVGSADPTLLKAFEEHVPHVVLVDNRDMTGKQDCLYSDGFGGAFEAARFLISLGHRRIGFLNSAAQSFAWDDRLFGYLCALHVAGIPADPTLICVAAATDDTANKCVSVADIANFLIRPDRPTAVMAVNDAHALALLHTCHAMNISVPGDLSIVGFDDVDFSAHTYPPLTTVRVDKNFLGRASVRRLYERMRPKEKGADGTIPGGIRIEIPTKLVKRQSTAPPKYS
jgi:DNA-binding LacI/PurR family transcriptional regulator